MGSKRYMGAILRLLVSLAGVSLCCLCLAPVARADWGTMYCETSAASTDVDTVKLAIAEYQDCINGLTPGVEPCADTCCQTNAFNTQCTTLWTYDSWDFYMCGSLRCDNCMWIISMWQRVLDECTQSYGIYRAAGFVSYNWTPLWWNKYGF